jgi:hypothetical protein
LLDSHALEMLYQEDLMFFCNPFISITICKNSKRQGQCLSYKPPIFNRYLV